VLVERDPVRVGLHADRLETDSVDPRPPAGRLAVAPDVLKLAQARDERHDRIGAGRHDDVFGAVVDAVDLDHAGSGQPAAAAQQVDARAASQRSWPASEFAVVPSHFLTQEKAHLVDQLVLDFLPTTGEDGGTDQARPAAELNAS
jgi:hypothetical protein